MNFVPRVHGNGFIQLDLTPEIRLHVWGHPEIPKQSVPTPIHDHSFGFTSRILSGTLVNRLYEYRVALHHSDKRYVVHQARVREGEDTILESIGIFCNLLPQRSEERTSGQTYQMKPGQIHESIPIGPTVSIITKDALTLSQGGKSPRVFVPVGVTPDNTFNRYSMNEAWIWSIIARVLRDARIPLTQGRT